MTRCSSRYEPKEQPEIASRQVSTAGALASNTLTSHSPGCLFQRRVAIVWPTPRRRNLRMIKNS